MFEELLAHHPSRGRSRVPFTAAIALHVTAALALVGASLWSVEDAPEPETRIFPLVLGSPPPRGSDTAPPARPSLPKAARRLPVALPAELPPPAEITAAEPDAEPESAPDGGGGIGGAGEGPPGLPDGVPGGTGTEPTAGVALAEGGNAIFVPGGNVRAPLLVSRVEPDYPDAARRARLEGDVVVEAIITGAGDVEEVRVVKSAGVLLDRAALEAVGRWRYRPATLNGRAVRVRLTVVVSFRLH